MNSYLRISILFFVFIICSTLDSISIWLLLGFTEFFFLLVRTANFHAAPTERRLKGLPSFTGFSRESHRVCFRRPWKGRRRANALVAEVDRFSFVFLFTEFFWVFFYERVWLEVLVPSAGLVVVALPSFVTEFLFPVCYARARACVCRVAFRVLVGP